MSRCIHAEAVAALHLLALRRQFDKVHQLFGEEPPHRSREVLWAALEVAHAHLRGERIGLRDLVARAEGLVSAPTLSRVVAEAERAGLLTSEPAPEHGRMKLLHPTERTLGLLASRAEAAFAQFAAIVHAAEGRLADAGAAGQQSGPGGRRGPARPPGQASQDPVPGEREEAVAKLRQVDVLVSQGQTVAEAIRAIGVTEVTYYRWRREFEGLKLDQGKRLKDLEAENVRLRRAVADLTLDKQILAEAAQGNS